MNVKDKEEVIRRYGERLLKFGKSVKTMGWRNTKQQKLRFSVLSAIGDLHSRSILDLGCGFGDLYAFLRGKGIKFNYTGYDISPDIIKVAQKAHPGVRFEVKDILTDMVSKKFDYVFSSGVFNHRISNNLQFTKDMIRKMFEIAKVGVAVNMMTDYVDYKEDYLFYNSPEKIFRFAKGLSRYAVLRHDYPLFEFTVYIYKKENYK